MESQARPGRKASVVYYTALLCTRQLQQYCVSLPRQFPPPVFFLQYAKMEGEGLGESRAWRQVDVKVDVRGGGAQWRI